jgi:hypothetical protein
MSRQINTALDKESEEEELNGAFRSRKKLFSEERCIHGESEVT